MVLSIGMIVKNEEKYLERCLTALQPILNELDSELIIADTGSTDRTVEIAKKFTDNVFRFEWINDFAAARNSTLEKARGEWYMFIDADEIIQDCFDIIRFFKSKEYKKYNSGTYVVRSYTDASDMTSYKDIRSQRLISTAKGSKFIGKIHETFDYFYAPIKYLNVVADHYGYLFIENDVITELAHKKVERNLKLLLEELEDENVVERQPCIYNEIADCYDTIGDREKALEYINIGLDKVDHRIINITAYYAHKVALLFLTERISDVVLTAEEYFNAKSNPSHTQQLASDCEVCYYAGCADYKLKNYSKSVKWFANFFNAYYKYKQGKLNTSDLMYKVFSMDDANEKIAYDIFFRCCYQEKEFALAKDYAKSMPLEKYLGDQNFMITHLNVRVEMMENLGYNNLDNLYRQLDDFGKNHLLIQIRRRVFKTNPQNRTVIIKKLAALGGICAELAEIYKSYFESSEVNLGLAKVFLENHGSENGEDILYILLENQMDISPFLLTDDFFADRAVQISINFFPNSVALYENYNIDIISQDGLVRATSFYGWIMRRIMERNGKISKFFESYGSLGLKWYNTFGEVAVLPGDIRAALLVNNVVSAMKSGNQNNFMSAVRELGSIVPDLIPLVDAYKTENENAFKTTLINPEFDWLAAQVKHNIRAMIDAEDFTSAWELLAEYEVLCPDDTDVELLKNEIADKF